MAKTKKQLVICLDNADYEASLERRKIYVSLSDAEAEARGFLRVIDESEDDYLYPSVRFVHVKLPQATRRAVMHA